MHRSKMSERERTLHSRLAQWVSSREIIRGTLTKRKIVCGKPNCCCAKGDKHEAVCLVRSRNGHIEQLHIPRDWEGRVRQWVKQYRDICEGLEQISCIYWEKIRNRQE